MTHDVPALLRQFASEYFPTTEWSKHQELYRAGRASAQVNWQEIRDRAARGESVHDDVLLKLLPHLNTAPNRARGAWIHVAPTVTKDVKKWFENAGWASSDNWPHIAALILNFFDRVLDEPSSLPGQCAEFSNSPYSKGFQSAFLSPLLSAIRPDNFVVVNRKVLETIEYVTGQSFSARLREYPLSNATTMGLVAEYESTLRALAPDARPSDTFDAFCHWLVAIKKMTSTDGGGREEASSEQTLDRDDPDVAARLIERWYPDADTRDACSRSFADAIALAAKHGPSRWSVTLTRSMARLNLGRVAFMQLSEDVVRVGLVSSALAEPLQSAIEEACEGVEPFASADGAALYDFPPKAFLDLRDRIEAAFREFARVAAETARSTPYKTGYSPGLLRHLESRWDSPLPRPAHDTRGGGAPVQMPTAIAIRTPRTVFKKVDYDLSSLLTYLDNGDIGLPDIQRPFVWKASKVRDLFDSMYRGFPVGYLLFWENSEIKGTRAVGFDAKPHPVPALLIVDGQQRLTSLFSVLRGKTVLDDNYKSTRLEIAFRPRDGKFEVCDAAIRNDPEYIPDISELWTSDRASFRIVSDFLTRLRERRDLSKEDEDAIAHNLDRLYDLQKYPFTALEISPVVNEEAVADIFVRINSEGVKLKQADFILTLLSVFWDDGRRSLEEFARAAKHPASAESGPSPYNHLIAPDPDQMLRTAIAIGFHRARLRSVYQLLRGKDMETGAFSPARRDEQFAKLKDAQAKTLNLNHWHGFLGSISAAGFRSSTFVSSEVALVYSYALYLIGKLQCGVDDHTVQRIVGRWYFLAALTGRYAGSSETEFEKDLSRVRDLNSADRFVETLERVMSDTLTRDYWEITLPNELETSSPQSPTWHCYVAAQVRLGSPVLFSEKLLWTALDPSVRALRSGVERHHLFPRAWLEKNGFADKKMFNQIANFAYLEWPDNAKIGATAPSVYVPALRDRFAEVAWERMCEAHALPEGWHAMAYPDFLRRRRLKMAEVIRKGFNNLASPEYAEVHDAIAEGTPAEQAVWSGIQRLEKLLREVVRSRYAERWGGSADARIRAALGDQAWSTVERNREKYRSQYGIDAPASRFDVLDFCYLGQLAQLMVTNEAWGMFQGPFRDKRELEDQIRAIVPVRNDAAHFRSIPALELQRCRVATEDLLKRIAKL